MNKNEFKNRLKQLAVKTGWLCLKLPQTIVNKVYTGQLVRSSSSYASDYRAACRGKSKADFSNKLRIAEEELDETMCFYEMLAEFNPDFKTEFRNLYKEADELLSITVDSINTANANLQTEKQANKKSEIANLKSEIKK
ncbi:MAG: four helix bundle protein [Bacteroidota bacterium]|nr:four helix bundle protein [Bacteroidota bacterium]